MLLLKLKNEFKGEIPSITTIAFLTNVGNDLVKKSDYNTKINEIKKVLIMVIIIRILLLQNLITKQQKLFLQD